MTCQKPPAPLPSQQKPDGAPSGSSGLHGGYQVKKVPVVDEFELLRYTQCPLLVPKPLDDEAVEQSAAADATADDVLEWLTREAFDGCIPTLPVVREHANHLFLKRHVGEMTCRTARRLNRMARRLHDLVSFNRVLHPVERYEIDLGLVRVDGMVTILHSKLKPHLPPMVLRLRMRKVTPPLAADVVSIARWLYAARESGFPSCRVYNYSLSGDSVVNQQFEEPLAQRWLTAAALSWRNKYHFPNPGPHCSGCQKACRMLPDLFSRDAGAICLNQH